MSERKTWEKLLGQMKEKKPLKRRPTLPFNLNV